MEKTIYGAALALALSSSIAAAAPVQGFDFKDKLGAPITQTTYYPNQSTVCDKNGPTKVQASCTTGCDIKWKACTATLGGLPSNDPQVVRCRNQLKQCLSHCS